MIYFAKVNLNKLLMSRQENNKTKDSRAEESRPDNAADSTPGDFANRLANARRLVESLERPGEDLDQAMLAYTQAMEDLNWCREYLSNARLRVEQLVAKG